MLLTVFAYIPLIEEENARAGTELSKKNSESDCNEDTDPDTEEGFGSCPFTTGTSRLRFYSSQQDHHFINQCNHYDFRSFNRTSPPPKI